MQPIAPSAPLTFRNRISKWLPPSSLGWLLAFCATVLMSANSPIGRGVILQGVSPTLLLALRFILSTILATLSFAATDLSLLKIGRSGCASDSRCMPNRHLYDPN